MMARLAAVHGSAHGQSGNAHHALQVTDRTHNGPPWVDRLQNVRRTR